MGTVTMTSAGFAVLAATAPNNWPENIKWPAGGNVNGTKTYTISDADMLQIMSWAFETYNAKLIEGKPPPPPYTVGSLQGFVAWIDGFFKATMDSVQRQQTEPAVIPPPIDIT
jgi:hypothetical protein